MASAKSNAGKKGERRNLPDDVSRLIEVIRGEIKSPADMQSLLGNLPAMTTCAKEAAELLKAKDRAQRRQAFIKSEPMWYKKYGWFMARIVGLFGILIFAFSFFMQGTGTDFVISMILGAACYYMLLVTLSNVRYRDKNKKRAKLLEREEQQYQKQIARIASSLFKRFNIDPARFPINDPKSPAGLERREKGYFIPID
jgi:membrane protein YqaA with SNARE-associated domain